MAKYTSKKKQRTVSTPILLDVKPDTPSYYVNYVGVSHTAYDFTLSVSRIPSPLPQEQVDLVKSGKPLSIEASLQIIIPPLLIDGLIKALIDQKERHAETLSQQGKNNELPQQHVKPLGFVR